MDARLTRRAREVCRVFRRTGDQTHHDPGGGGRPDGL